MLLPQTAPSHRRDTRSDPGPAVAEMGLASLRASVSPAIPAQSSGDTHARRALRTGLDGRATARHALGKAVNRGAAEIRVEPMYSCDIAPLSQLAPR